MANSHGEQLTLSCKNCGREFAAQVWLIVDTGERPDLLAEIRAGELHTTRCPHCGAEGQVDAPLLLFRPDAEPPILFSPAQQTTAEQDREQAAGLVNALRQRLADQWQEAWLAEGLPGVQRPVLAAALSDDPEAALRQLAEEQQQALAELAERDPEAFRRLEEEAKAENPLLSTLQAFIGADTWIASYQFVQRHPELVAEEAVNLLEQLLAAARSREDENAVQIFGEHRDLLRRCLEVGVDAAFAEKLEMPAEALAATTEMANLPPAVREVLAEIAASGETINSPEDFQRLLAARPDLQARLAAAQSPEPAFAVPDQFRADLQIAGEAVQRYRNTGDRTALDAAAAAWQRILDSPDFAATPERFQLAALNDSGGVFLRRYWAQGQVPDLDRALRSWSAAVQRTPADSPDRPALLNNLGNGLRDRYARTGRLADLEEAIRVYEEAVQRTPADSPDRPALLNNLGNGLRARYARTGRLADLEAAIRVYAEAVQRTPADSPDRPALLNNLGNGLRARYARTGRLADLEEAIRVYAEAVQRTPADSPDRPARLNNLGNGLRDRYARTGRLADLEEAIRVSAEAVQRTPADSPDRPGYLNNLGNGLRDRYARTGRLADLEEAIRVYEEAVQRTPADSPDRPARLNNLGTGLSARYARTGRLADLEEAIRVSAEAVQRTPADSPDRPARLNNLGNGLRDRYARTGRLADLEEAIRVSAEAVQRTPADSPDRPGYLNNLGNGLSARYARTGRLADLEEAIRVYAEAVQRTPADSPDRPARLNNLGNGLRDRYARTGDPHDKQKATGFYETACREGLDKQAEATLVAARSWGRWAMNRRAWPEAMRAFAYGHQGIERLYHSQLLQSRSQQWLRETQGMAGQAAYALSRDGKVKEAVIILENGRTRSLNATLARDRADLEQLQKGAPALFERYRQAAAQLRQLESSERQQNLLASTDIAPDWNELRRQIQQARDDLEETIAAIRKIEGYAAFLAAPGYTEIVAAMIPGTALAYLVTTPVGSLILLLHNAGKEVAVEPIWADDYNEKQLNELLIIRNDGELIGGYLPGQMGHRRWLKESLDKGLPQLGEYLIAPLATRLWQLNIDRVTLIPAGRLNLLPLHAAVYTIDQVPRALLDDFAVSYAPSAQALTQSRKASARLSNTAPTLLAVGNPLPLPTGVRPLAFARPEVEEIVPRFAGRATVFFEEAATHDAVTRAIPGKTYAHFSCHGFFDPEKPLASGLMLSEDKTLSLTDILDRLDLKQTRMAILSACQTAINDFNNVPDEMVGLPAGFLQAGVPGVVGTLWPVNDLSTALFMDRFYRLHLDEGREPAAALGAAQRWLREVTNRELSDLFAHLMATAPDNSTRMAFDLARKHYTKRTLREPDEQPYNKPYYWAPFTFYGV